MTIKVQMCVCVCVYFHMQNAILRIDFWNYARNVKCIELRMYGRGTKCNKSSSSIESKICIQYYNKVRYELCTSQWQLYACVLNTGTRCRILCLSSYWQEGYDVNHLWQEIVSKVWRYNGCMKHHQMESIR